MIKRHHVNAKIVFWKEHPDLTIFPCAHVLAPFGGEVAALDLHLVQLEPAIGASYIVVAETDPPDFPGEVVDRSVGIRRRGADQSHLFHGWR